MTIARSILIFALACGILLLMGCSSSKQASTTGEVAAPPQTEKAAPPVDTLTVDTRNAEKPAYESRTPPSTAPVPPAGKFTVQVGAYKMPDNADRIASLAKERFARPVYTILDKADNLFKVMIGDFLTKDDARRFRDDMVQKYPSDYKDAWVSENPQ